MTDWKPNVGIPEGNKPRCVDSLIGKSNCDLHTTGASITWCIHKLFDNHLVRAINAMAIKQKERDDYELAAADLIISDAYEFGDNMDWDEHKDHLKLLVKEGNKRGFRKAHGPGYYIPKEWEHNVPTS